MAHGKVYAVLLYASQTKLNYLHRHLRHFDHVDLEKLKLSDPDV